MYNKNYRQRGKSSRDFKERMNYEDEQFVPHQDKRPPLSDGSGAYNPTINMKVMSGLPNSSYAMKVDPYVEANNPATPYSFLANFNKVMGGRYAGNENLMGGNLNQYNNSFNSGFLKVFDCALMNIGLNYNYLPVLATDTKRGQNMIDEVRKAIAEVVSALNATTFKDQNIYYYVVRTSLPMGSAPKKTVQGIEGEVYYQLEDVIYAYCMEYQLVLQNMAMAFNMFNAHRTRMGTMIRMSWDREVSVLNSYFGLLKKKSFLSLFDSISQNLAGEYFDQEFMRQANTFCMAASRRSNCINDPLLEISARINMPDVFVSYICSDAEKTQAVGPVYDFAKMNFTPAGTDNAISFQDAVSYLQTRLTVTDTLDWARNVTPTLSENARFNEIKTMLDVLTACFTYFKTTMNDLRTVLTIMNRIGVVKWTLGTRLTVTKDTDCTITNYLVVNNVYEEIFSGSPDARFNGTTMRWRTHTLWNLYYGTPEYANYSGGSFFTFSTKDLIVDTSTAHHANVGYVPVAFSLVKLNDNLHPDSYAVCSARDGSKAWLGIDTVEMSGNEVFARLVPLQTQSTLKIRVPKPVQVSLKETQSKHYDAFLYRLMLQIAGVGESQTGDYSLDPDTIAVYEYEIEDFTNEVIAYARSHGPFQVSQFTENTLGFYGLKTATRK